MLRYLHPRNPTPVEVPGDSLLVLRYLHSRKPLTGRGTW
ncbi:hypothetical protein BN12_4140001 [Nostocoides japonicum T1-X7]|uniref:Uncharacterized protein n=1 Tax=Nostocoides japonicum T1-X7 TaxID=1194083 RepID=A0A077M5H7_9MICO|nr:hypothetical protein BN12_4140001 [Tetrasphaera japonica T1-X7]